MLNKNKKLIKEALEEVQQMCWFELDDEFFGGNGSSGYNGDDDYISDCWDLIEDQDNQWIDIATTIFTDPQNFKLIQIGYGDGPGGMGYYVMEDASNQVQYDELTSEVIDELNNKFNFPKESIPQNAASILKDAWESSFSDEFEDEE